MNYCNFNKVSRTDCQNFTRFSPVVRRESKYEIYNYWYVVGYGLHFVGYSRDILHRQKFMLISYSKCLSWHK